MQANFAQLDPSMKQFEYMLSMQSEWQEIYVKQEKVKQKARNEAQAAKNHYGNSSEYWKDWKKNGAQINK